MVRYTPTITLDAKALYESGLTVAQVALALGTSYGRAHKILKSEGVAFRARGPRKGDPESSSS